MLKHEQRLLLLVTGPTWPPQPRLQEQEDNIWFSCLRSASCSVLQPGRHQGLCDLQVAPCYIRCIISDRGMSTNINLFVPSDQWMFRIAQAPLRR